MSQNNPENLSVVLSYGQNGFLSVGSPTDETAPSPPPKRPYFGFQGHVGTLTGFTVVRIYHAIKFGRRVFPPRADPKENPLWGVFGPFWALGGRKFL